MRALVTGGTGFIGSHVVRELVAQGHTVRVLHRASSKLTALDGLSYETAIGDLNDSAALRTACDGCDWVFHVAAVADYWRADRTAMFDANVGGTQRILAAANEVGVRRVVFTSSAAAVGLRDNLASEQTPFDLPPQQFPYGYSKALAERAVHDAVRAGQDVVIVNPVVVMGPGDLNQISGSFVTQIKQLGALTPMTSGGLAVVDVRDVARWQILAAERGETGQRYILGTANYSYRQWFAMIAQTVGVRAPVVMVPDALVPLIAEIATVLAHMGVTLPVDSDQIRLSTRQIHFDYTRAWNAFGQPRIDMLTSLRDSYRWYAEHGVI